MDKKILVVVVGIAVAGAAFFGGTLFAKSGTAGTSGRAGFAGGPMEQLSATERSRIQNMTDAERQAYFQEKAGSQAASGTVGTRGPRGGLIEGDVLEVASDTVTVKLTGGGSQTVYTDANTVIGYAEGAGKIAVGSPVLVFSQPSADNVVTAQAILVKK